MDDLIGKTTFQSAKDQFAPSWIDRFVVWIEKLPIPVWLFYTAAILTFGLVITASLWLDGSVPLGEVGSIQGIYPPAVLSFLILYHYLTKIASRSLQTFRPLLDANEAEVGKIEYDLTMLPRWVGRLSILIGLALTFPYLMNNPATWGNLVPKTVYPYIAGFIIVAYFSSTMILLFIRSVRQLRIVGKLHQRAANIDLLDLEPAHAFSVLTARTGIGIFLIILIGTLSNPSAILGAPPWNIYGLIFIGLLSVTIFVFPIMGMRERLKSVKRKAMKDLNELLRATDERLHNQVKIGDFEDIGGMDTALSALIREREMLEKISTWPWNPGTVRGFASTLLLPIFLWLITRLLERII